MEQKLNITFSKTANMRYISHLDLVRLFQRASRRAGFPVAMTKGYSPHLKISIQKALKLGIESAQEAALFSMDAAVADNDFLTNMNAKLPDGVRILKVER